MALNRVQMENRLAKLGWRVAGDNYARAVADFQRGYNGPGAPLLVDGKAGPKTQAAVEWSQARRLAGKSTASEHFSFSEFACKCGGRRNGCRRIRVHRELLVSLEQYRAVAGPVSVVSGYRCPGHNAAVGGASTSQHVYGSACDITPKVKTVTVSRLRAFAGIGYQGGTGLVRHVDRRDCSGVNPTGGTCGRPTLWRY